MMKPADVKRQAIEDVATLAAKGDEDLYKAKIAELEAKLKASEEKLVLVSKANAVESPPPPNIKCSVCGQSMAFCRGKHTTLLVMPPSNRFWNDFPGVKVNGHLYYYNCVVPDNKQFKNDLLSMAARWQASQEELQLGKGKVVRPELGALNPAMFG